MTTDLWPGETLLWSGRPTSVGRLVIRSVPHALVGLAVGAFCLLWIVMVARGGHNNWDRGVVVPPFAPHNVLIATFAGLWMIPPTLLLLTRPLWIWRNVRQTSYVLTDKRAIVAEPGFLGRARMRSYAAEALGLMYLEEHRDGTGDLIFENRRAWGGWSQPVGFLAIACAFEVEALVRRTLLSEDRSEPGLPALAIPARKTYSIALDVRLFQFVFFAGGLLVSFCILGNFVLALGVLVLRPKLLFALIPHQVKDLGVLGVAGSITVGIGSLLAACFVAWGFFHFALAIPIEITIDDDGTVGFRSRLRTVRVPAGNILAIRTGGWLDPNRFQAVVRHKGGKLVLVNRFNDFRDFLATVKALNPTVEIEGF